VKWLYGQSVAIAFGRDATSSAIKFAHTHHDRGCLRPSSHSTADCSLISISNGITYLAPTPRFGRTFNLPILFLPPLHLLHCHLCQLLHRVCRDALIVEGFVQSEVVVR
jgi:hypothetical protein